MGNSQSDLEAKFLFYWNALAPSDLHDPAVEHRFAPHRRFRFDVAFVEQKIAIELQGGIWMRTKSGRSAGHAYGARMERDYEKLNLAQSLGWAVFYFTGGMLDRDPVGCIELVKVALSKKEAGE